VFVIGSSQNSGIIRPRDTPVPVPRLIVVVSFGMRTVFLILMVCSVASCANVRKPGSESVSESNGQGMISAPSVDTSTNDSSLLSKSDENGFYNETHLQKPSQHAGSNTSTIPEEPHFKAWPFRPSRVRIHPLSYFEAGTSNRPRVLHLRLEFFDLFEHNTKGLGTIEFELYSGSGSTEPIGTRSRLEAWVSDINDLQQNLERYDDVTRTYLFPLKIDPDLELPERGRFVVTVLTLDNVLRDEAEIRLK